MQNGTAIPSLRKFFWGNMPFLSGVCPVFRTEVVHDIGGFDEQIFTGCEDVDISIRISKSGYALCLIPQIMGTHLGSRTSRKYAATVQKSRKYLLHKHFSYRRIVAMQIGNLPAYVFFVCRNPAKTFSLVKAVTQLLGVIEIA